MPDKYRRDHRQNDYKNTDNESTMYIPNDSDQYRQSAQEYSGQYYGQHEQPQQQYYDPNQQYYGQEQQQYYDPNQQYYGQEQQQYYDPNQQYYQQNQQQFYGQQQYYSQPEQPAYTAPAPPPPPQQRPVRQRRPAPKSHKKRKHHIPLALRILRRILLTLLCLFLVLFGVYSCTSLSIIKKINYVPDGDRTRNPDAISESYVTSVLIIGTDGRSDDDRGRSDSMILVSFNKKTKTTWLTSFMRDSYVDIPGYGWGKLNWAYSYGGPELLMDTIENNFCVKIDNYVSINFMTFAAVIDAVGGIDIEITDEEANEINVILLNEVNEIMGDVPNADFVEHGGEVHLSGKQALCYSRIRYVGNSDFERTSRQRRVITEVMKKAAKHGPSFLKNVSKSALPQMTTNMTNKQLYALSLRFPFMLKYDTENLQIPVNGTYEGKDVYFDDGTYQSVLDVDFDANLEEIEDTVFSE